MAIADDDHYETLGVSSDASPQQIHEAFRSLIRVHRDRPGEPDPARIERAWRINIAHTILQDPIKRQKYNDSIVDGLPQSHQRPEAVSVESDEPAPRKRRNWSPLAAIVLLGVTAMALVTFYPVLNVDRLRPATTDSAESQISRSVHRVDSNAATTLINGIFAPLTADKTAAASDAEKRLSPRPSDPLGGEPADRQTAANASAFERPKYPAASKRILAPSLRTNDPVATIPKGPAGAENAGSAPVADPPAPLVDRAASAGRAKEAPARFLGGGLTDADNVDGKWAGTVGIRFIVQPRGSISNCRAEQSSGDAGLDQLTCQLLAQRLRFAPATDAQGKPVPSEMRTTMTWGRRQRAH